MIGLPRVVPHRKGLVPVGIESHSNVRSGFYAVLIEQSAQLLKRHLDTLMQLRGRSGLLAGKGAFEVVENGQEFADEGFLFRRSLLLGIAPGALSEIIEVGGKTQVIVLLRGQRLQQLGWVDRRRIGD